MVLKHGGWNDAARAGYKAALERFGADAGGGGGGGDCSFGGGSSVGTPGATAAVPGDQLRKLAKDALAAVTSDRSQTRASTAAAKRKAEGDAKED